MSVRRNGLWAAAAMAAGLVVFAPSAEAQEDDPWGEYEEPEDTRDRQRTTTADVPEGMWAAGGIHGNARRGIGGGGLRGEFGLPVLEVSDDMRLAIAFPLYTGHRRWYNQLYIVPEVQFEIDLPIDMPHKLSVVPYAGLGLSMHFWAAGWRGPGFGSTTDVAITLPLGAWARFTMDNGFMAQVMPLGMSLNVAVTSTPITSRFFAGYHFFAMAGYRWD